MTRSGAVWVLGLALAWPSVADAQSGRTASSASAPTRVAVQQPPVQDDPRIRIDLGDTTPWLPGAVTVGKIKIDGVFQPGTARVDGGFGPTWQATAAAHYRTPGGFDVSGALVARRGYQGPMFMATGAGTDVIIPTAGQAFVATSRVPVLFDTRLRVARRVFTRGGVNVDLLAEALNLVNANVSREAGDLSETLTSRTFRFGVLLGF